MGVGTSKPCWDRAVERPEERIEEKLTSWVEESTVEDGAEEEEEEDERADAADDTADICIYARVVLSHVLYVCVLLLSCGSGSAAAAAVHRRSGNSDRPRRELRDKEDTRDETRSMAKGGGWVRRRTPGKWVDGSAHRTSTAFSSRGRCDIVQSHKNKPLYSRKRRIKD